MNEPTADHRGPSSQHRQERSELRERRALSVQRAGGACVGGVVARFGGDLLRRRKWLGEVDHSRGDCGRRAAADGRGDRKSTRLNSSHLVISYAVFCLKKK